MDNTTVAEEGQVKNKIVVVKKEPKADEEIKEFAETAMNELLGWYGYGPNHSKDIMQQRTANSCKSRSNSNSSGPDSPKFTEGCGWCGKVVDDSNGLSSGSSTFCSELCFSQSRRANFKKNKTCDWCRHVRHTVSYVDFQDGASQLQFCSDKCLNQYKMHIFCRETRAHLEMHPHLIGEDSTTAGLITPDLWMKNCKSPSLSIPTTTATLGAPTSRTPSPVCRDEQTSPLPLITVAHPSKLLASPPDRTRSPRVKRTRKRQPSTATKVSESPQDLRIRHSPIPDPPHVYPAHPPQQPQPPHPAAPDHHYYHHQLPSSFPPHPMLMRPTNSVLPPVTVMVPYPVAVPIPIPIPIPLPLSSFLKAAEIKNNLLQEAAAAAAAVAAATAASQNTADESSQNTTAPVEDEPEVEPEVEETKEDEIVVDDVKTSPARPVRKRKRVVEAKAKIVLKSKKPLSV